MSEQIIGDDELLRVLDILQQVRRLNEMIDFHRANAGQPLMLRQYEEMRHKFMGELKAILSTFKLDVQMADMAA